MQTPAESSSPRSRFSWVWTSGRPGGLRTLLKSSLELGRSSRGGSVGEEPHAVSVRMQVRSLALLSGLRIWPCHKPLCRSQMAARIQCGCGMDCSSDPSPSLGTSICHGFSCKKGKRVKLGNLPGVWLIAESSQTTLCVAPVPCLNYGNSEVHYFLNYGFL